MENRRKSTRIPLITIARINRQGLESASEALVRDICTHGIGIYTKESYKKGDLILVHIALTTDKNETLDESIMGEVAWVSTMPGEYSYAVGIRFSNMIPEKPRLYNYIKHLEQQGGHQA